ncbi:alpha/beta hydrolase family protein [Euzebya tangerina]|uniref:alpha/beta hydrolase family protein n=1 Tax=Euzebya tangerina TaxID=591198 RepID=UPI0013C3647C|nr:hypothetical protein [Euzebya tangerina]
MRPLEVGLVVVTAVVVLWPLVRTSRIIGAAVAFGGVAVAVLQAVIEGARWQVAPIYALLAVVLGWRVARIGGDKTAGPRIVSIAGGAVVLALAALLMAALPVPALPQPEGPNLVGTTAWIAVDTARPDRLSPAFTASQPPPAQREVVVQAWYPTAVDGDPAPWVADAAAFAEQLAPEVGLPVFTLGHLSHTRMGATADVPIAPGQWPIVVYSHGWGGFRTVQSDLAEHLASHGYVVISLDHTYGSNASIFPSGPVFGADESDLAGQVIGQNPAALPELEDVGGDAYVAATTLLEQTFAEDVAVVLDQIAEGDHPDLLGTLDTSQVGLTGHSTGGGAMVRLCLTDDRCAGVFGLDPWVEPVPGELLSEGLDDPLVSLRSEEWDGNDNDQVLRALHEGSPGDRGLFVIPGANHQDFTLQPFLSPLAGPLGLSGPGDDAEIHDAVDRLAQAFFDQIFSDDGGDLLAEPPAPIQADDP